MSFEARDGMLCQNSKLKNCDKARQGMLCRGKYFSEGFPSNESRRQQNAQILGHLGPKLRGGEKKKRNECISQKEGCWNESQSAESLNSGSPPAAGAGTPTS